MKNNFKVILFLLFLIIFNHHSYSKDSGSLNFKLEVDQRFKDYDFLLNQPSILALAIKNSGFEFSQTRPVTLINNKEFNIGPGKLKFIDNKKNIFTYKATLFLNIGIKTEIDSLINVDINNLSNKIIEINVYSEFFNLIPESIINQIKSKLEKFLDERIQLNLLNYLDDVLIRVNNKNNNESTFESIIFTDSYNYLINYGSNRIDNGYKGKTGDAILLIISILGLLCVFLVFGNKIRNKRKKND